MTRAQVFQAHLHQIVSSASSLFGGVIRAIPIAIIAGVITYVIIRVFVQKKNEIPKYKKTATVLSVMYIAILFQDAIFSRQMGHKHEIDWIPFDTVGGLHLLILMVLANLVIFIPMGILVPMIWKSFNSYWKICLLTLLISVCIEAIQYIFGCGFCQLEDVIMNVAGAIVGLWIFRLVKKKKGKTNV